MIHGLTRLRFRLVGSIGTRNSYPLKIITCNKTRLNPLKCSLLRNNVPVDDKYISDRHTIVSDFGDAGNESRFAILEIL